MYLHQPRGPGVKNLWCCETKLSIAGVKKGSYSRKKLHLGLAFCRAGTGTPRLIKQKQKQETGKGTYRVQWNCSRGHRYLLREAPWRVAASASEAEFTGFMCGVGFGALESTLAASWQGAFFHNGDLDGWVAEVEVPAQVEPPSNDCDSTCRNRALHQCMLRRCGDCVFMHRWVL